MIIQNNFSFGIEELKEEEEKESSLTNVDEARMSMVKIIYGPMPDSLVEVSLIKKHPQLF